uniref:Uncharacterized protein n=1 Tax=Dunaliella tertiolecta TaxID=3047 RepID=A0A7S3VK66_DUNTE|mmetsp:Transcript_10507/g.28757  ORF Transcript_10507/g.28757 Transcript_10507/m.28757 type:complete len:524 (+) Transcript_10507:43-1614(+)
MRVSMLSETCSPPNVSAPRSHMMMAAGSMKRQATRMVCAAAEKVAVPVAAGATQTAEAVLDNPTNQKVSFVSLGCPKNVVDGEVILGDLYKSGFEVTQEHEDADAIVINTCAFVQDAKSESIEAIMEAAALNEDGKRRKIVVTGCLAQRYNSQLAQDMPEADMVMGFENYHKLPSSLQELMGTQQRQQQQEEASTSSRVQVGAATLGFRPEWDRYRLTPKHHAYLRVAEGCSHACTFCAIPGFRGKFRSKPWASVLDEAKRLVASGVKELNLIAEDTNQYGMDRRDGFGLAELMRELGKLEGLHWMRILYAYPSYFTEELIDEIANNPKVCKYIDIPLQHINNLVLLSMNRPPQNHTVNLLKKLRERIPGLVLRTTFICGFPGETQAQHRELVDFCKEFKFERMGAFAYSEEDGTPAADYPEQVADKTRQRRRDELISLQQRIGESFAEQQVGKEIDVLVDGYSEDGALIGRTQWDAPDIDPIVFLSEEDSNTSGLAPLEVGQLRRCRVIGNSIFDLEACPIA